MYRVIFYYQETPEADRTTMVAHNQKDWAQVQRTIATVLSIPGMTGGNPEVFVPGGLGWVVADEENEETIQIIARRREDN